MRGSFDIAAAQPTQDATVDGGQREAGRRLMERALVDLGIDWEGLMSYQVDDDRIAVVVVPVGLKRARWFPAGGAGGPGSSR